MNAATRALPDRCARRSMALFVLMTATGLLANWSGLELFFRGDFLLVSLLVMFMLLCHTVRQHRRMEETLRQGELHIRRQFEELNQIYKYTPVGLFALDRDQRYLRINEYLAAIGGKRIEEYVGRTVDEVLPHEFAIRLKRLWQPVLERGEAVKNVELETPGEGMPCGPRHWLVNYYPLVAEDGAVTGLMGTVQDITDRKLIEKQMQQLNENLEELVQIEVAKNREKDQIMIAQGRQAAMGEMIGNIAHQWRQPLNALGLLLANIKDAYDFGELNGQFMEQASADGNRLVQKMSSTINDFRNFFHPGKERVPFSAYRQIREAVALVNASFLSEGVQLHIETPHEVNLYGFPNEFSQVLLNLFYNSREAILAGRAEGGTIRVRLGRSKGLGCIRVSDNGGGIPEDVLERVFEPYFSTKPMGSGIGLYMSKMIIERSMHGRIEACNIPGGACFSILLPMAGAEYADRVAEPLLPDDGDSVNGTTGGSASGSAAPLPGR